jgi:hypothetical protein
MILRLTREEQDFSIHNQKQARKRATNGRK